MSKKKPKSFFKQPQNIIALAVSLISICALVVSIKQTQIMSEQRVLMHQQAKVSVWPRLEVGLIKSHNLKDYSIEQFNFNITNGGIGPAIIADIRITYDEKNVTYWGHLFEHFGLSKSTPLYYANRDLNNSIIKTGENLIFLNLSDNLPVAQGFYDNLEKIRIEIWYESIYGDKWKLSYKDQITEINEVDSDFTLPDDEQFKN